MPRSSYASAVLVAALFPNILWGQPEVIGVDEGWMFESKKLIQRQKLPDSANVTFKRKQPGNASVLVIECPNGIIIAYNCPMDSCQYKVCRDKSAMDVKGASVSEAPTEIPMAIFRYLKKTLSDLVEEKEPRYVTAAARAGGSPTDALLLSDTRGVHWGPALHRVLEGKYCLILKHLNKTQEPKTFVIDWDASVDAEGAKHVPGLEPGGYTLEKGTGEVCKADPDASPAWVVIAPAPAFNNLNADWSKTSAWLDQLSKTSTIDTVSAARHAFMRGMAELAKQQSGK